MKRIMDAASRLTCESTIDATGRDIVGQFSWSPDGNSIVGAVDRHTLRVWRRKDNTVCCTFEVNAPVLTCAWSPLDSVIGVATGGVGYNHSISIVSIVGGETPKTLSAPGSGWISDIAWHPSGRLIAAASEDGFVRVWSVFPPRLLWEVRANIALAQSIAWSCDGSLLASCGHDGMVKIWTEDGDLRTVHNIPDSRSLFSLSWCRNPENIAVGAENGYVFVINAVGSIRKLEGHSANVNCVSSSCDGKLLASRSVDNMIRLWRTEDWRTVAVIPASNQISPVRAKIKFVPSGGSVLAIFDAGTNSIGIWRLRADVVSRLAENTVDVRSAKVVFLGDSGAGKSCLALRLVEDRYEEQDTTHGLRLWSVPPDHWAVQHAPLGEHREVVIWDMGGQPEYQVVHQIFLPDTTVAAIVFDPSRGSASFERVRAWNRQIERHIAKATSVKILIGTKRDQARVNYVDPQVEELLKECGFSRYCYLSAKTGEGVRELKKAIVSAIEWDKMLSTTRPKLFQAVRDIVKDAREQGKVALRLPDIEKACGHGQGDNVRAAINVVIRQLAQQGLVAVARMSGGEQAIVVQVAAVEAYATSVILLALGNPLGVPAVEEAALVGQAALPGLRQSDRLRHDDEIVVLDCVVQLLVENGVGLAHEGLLVFPSLFGFKQGREPGSGSPAMTARYYRFMGALDNIYSSLVASLAMSQGFGRVLLWKDRAEFTNNGRGLCVLKRLGHPDGHAQLEVAFEEHTAGATRDVFVAFVAQHLAREGLHVAEHVALSCPCGYAFPAEILGARVLEGATDIGCPRCDKRSAIDPDEKDRASMASVHTDVFKLRRNADERTKTAIEGSRRRLNRSARRSEESVRILHISDLHITGSAKPEPVTQPLISDLLGAGTGLGLDRVDYLVVSGDITDRAQPDEYEAAYALLSQLMDRLSLSAARCIVVPGNHDVDWNEEVYTWCGKRRVSLDELEDGSWVEEGDGYLIRTDNYRKRFKNFNQHLYHPLLQRPFPLEVEEQGLSFFFEDSGIQFIALNSAWQIDEYNQARAGINAVSLAKTLKQADEQCDATVPKGLPTTRIAVFHHPITGDEKMSTTDFVENLQKAHVKLCLHGHVHEERADLVGYQHKSTNLYAVGAGSLAAPAGARPGTPKLYNLLEINAERIRVHTRQMRKDGGAWQPWAVWKYGKSMRSYFDVRITQARK